MTEFSNKPRAAKAVDPNYCEVLGRPCHSKACDFGCKELRGGSWRTAKPVPAAPPAPDLVNLAEVMESPATAEEPALSVTGIATDAADTEYPAASAPAAEEKLKQRRARQSKPIAPEATIELASLATGDKLAMLGVGQTGTNLDTMRETKRRLAALIAELKEAKRQTES
jgi:hypothetical protein